MNKKIDLKVVVSLLDSGKSVPEIAKIIGCSAGGVRDFIKRNDLEYKIQKTTNKYSEDEIEEIVEMIKAGKQIKEITAKTGAHKNTIQKYAKKYNLTFAGKKECKQYEQAIRTLYNEGYKVKEIADKLGFAFATMQNYLKRIGLPLDMEREKNRKIEIIKEYYYQGLCNEQIALRSGFAKSIIDKYLKELGLEENPNPEKTFINIFDKLEPMDDLLNEDMRSLSDEAQKQVLEYIIIKAICEKKSYLSRNEAERLPQVTGYYLTKHQISIPELNRRCGLIKPSSVFETQVEEYFIHYNIKYEAQKKFEGLKNERNLRFDFYLPDYNLLVECDGVQYVDHEHKFANAGQELRDNLKNEWCKENNIPLIRIPYTRYASDIYLDKYFSFIIHPENSSELSGNSLESQDTNAAQ